MMTSPPLLRVMSPVISTIDTSPTVRCPICIRRPPAPLPVESGRQILPANGLRLISVEHLGWCSISVARVARLVRHAAFAATSTQSAFAPHNGLCAPAISQDERRHVVGLGGSFREELDGRDQMFEDRFWLRAVTALHGLDEPFAPELVTGAIPRLRYPVAADNH